MTATTMYLEVDGTNSEAELSSGNIFGHQKEVQGAEIFINMLWKVSSV